MLALKASNSTKSASIPRLVSNSINRLTLNSVLRHSIFLSKHSQANSLVLTCENCKPSLPSESWENRPRIASKIITDANRPANRDIAVAALVIPVGEKLRIDFPDPNSSIPLVFTTSLQNFVNFQQSVAESNASFQTNVSKHWTYVHPQPSLFNCTPVCDDLGCVLSCMRPYTSQRWRYHSHFSPIFDKRLCMHLHSRFLFER
jgi:hypothetical protein